MMIAPFLAWSNSRLKQFLECPRQLWHSIAPKGHDDRVEFKQTKDMLAGLEVDDALTARIAKGKELPHKYTPYEGLCALIAETPGQKFTQMKLALDQTFKPCGYMDWNAAWVRVAYDVAIVNGDHAFILDWKNGQVWLDENQLKLYAATGFHQFPELEVIDTSYIWLKHGITSDKQYRRRELADLWQTFLPDVERMQVAWKTNHFPASPARGKKSCQWCPANQAGKCKEAQGPYGK